MILCDTVTLVQFKLTRKETLTKTFVYMYLPMFHVGLSNNNKYPHVSVRCMLTIRVTILLL